jgi:hypothetical protein
MRKQTIQLAVLLVVGAAGTRWLMAADELEKQASWQIPTTAMVRTQLDEFLAGQKLDEAQQLKVAALWGDPTEPLESSQLLDRLAATLSIVEPRAAEVIALCESTEPPLVVPRFALLDDESVAPLVRDNLRLLYGRWLAQQQLVDESLEYLGTLEAEKVVDPVSLLFYQAVGQHRLLAKNECLATVTKLLENEEALPRRYRTLAKLMEADIRPLKTDSLDEIARMMDDVRRRLELARAGKTVRMQEEQVVAKLEKLIEELEKQQQQQQQPGNGGGSQPSAPMQDSQAAQMRGAGEVDPKSLGKKDEWGNLPPKERQEVLQQIGRDLPAHFRETIEEYFKRLAQDGVR